jgi:hypothetical protein
MKLPIRLGEVIFYVITIVVIYIYLLYHIYIYFYKFHENP